MAFFTIRGTRAGDDGETEYSTAEIKAGTEAIRRQAERSSDPAVKADASRRLAAMQAWAGRAEANGGWAP